MTERSLLVVDDDRSILVGLRMIFGETYTLLTAERGSEALSLVREKAPDVILLDIGLPDMNGMDLLDQIKSLAPQTAIIMMTATEETETINGALELGVLEYLVKPMDALVLKTAIQNAFEKRASKLAAFHTVSG